MAAPSLADAARHVHGHYPILHGGTLIPLGNRGGFSGARLWQVETRVGLYCLRAWPPAGPDVERLQWLHRLMAVARSAGLTFVPAVLATRSETTHVQAAGRLWEAASWLPGRADFHAQPGPMRLLAACTALARMHGAWAAFAAAGERCPAVSRRLSASNDWQLLVRSGWRPTIHPGDPVAPWAERAWVAVARHSPEIPAKLAPWRLRPVTIQPCVCDIWHDHVLFDGEILTGLVDFGSVKLDHVAVDLARLLGSLVGDDAALRSAGLAAYRLVRPLAVEEEALLDVLDETGTVLGAANWLRWLYHEQRHYEDRNAVAQRLAALVTRMEAWKHEAHGPGSVGLETSS